MRAVGNTVRPLQRLICVVALLLLALTVPVAVTAQEAKEATGATAPAVLPDPYGRGTPRSAVTQLIGSLGAHDYDRAANYFDLPTDSNPRVHNGAAELAKRLQVLLDNGGSLKPFGSLSNEANGQIDDELAVDSEDVGSIPVGAATVPVLLTQRKVGDQEIWRISHATIRQLMSATVQAQAAQDAPSANQVRVAGAPLKDWAMLLGLAAFSFGGLWLISFIVLLAARRLIKDPATSGIYRFLHAAVPPFSLLFATGIFYTWVEKVPVAIVARQTLLRYAGIVSVVALVWFGLRLVDAIADVTIARMQRRERRQVISVVTLLRRTAKILLLAFSAVGILDTFGIDVTTGIAALGVGGIALALGAQKTVENLVGSVTVIADKPAQVGDFIKVGDVVGTVEDVGIRSTRIRTNNRTIVTIPNGDLSARQIENFATRDRFLFNPVIGVEYNLSAAKLREAIGIVQSVLTEHEHVAEGGRANLSQFGESSLDIEVFSYIDVRSFDESVGIKEELLLTIYERFEAAEIGIAFPTRTITFSGDVPAVLETEADPKAERQVEA